MLEWNVVCFHYMINYASMHVLVQRIPIFIMCMFMGLVSQVDSMSVASTSLVGGLGMLQTSSLLILYIQCNYVSSK